MKATTLIPIIVGFCAIILLEDTLSKLNRRDLQKYFQLEIFKYTALFGASYGATGGDIQSTFIALVLYHLFTTDTNVKKWLNALKNKDQDDE